MTFETPEDEKDFLLGMEFRLQQDLNAVHRRLEQIVGKEVVRHLVAVPDLPPEPDGA